VAPAFNVEVPTSGYTSTEASQFVAKTIENKIKELQGVDKIYSYSMDGFASVMVAFKVGVDQEIAKTRLYDKMYSNYDLRPFGIADVKIKSIDPEDLPQVSFALTYSGTDLDTIRTGKYLRNIAVTIREELKQVPGTTVMDILGGYRNDISIELDRQKIEAANLDMGQVMKQISTSFVHGTVGDIYSPDGKISVSLNTELSTIEAVQNLPIANTSSSKIYLRDIATIRSGPMDIASHYSFVEKDISPENTVFIGIAKLKGTNSVVVVDAIIQKMKEIEKTLPKNITIHTIQNEGETAREATNELMFHLFVSIAIVFVILVIFLGLTDAINAAFCIPMVLGIVFIVALILGLDINRITLFALILSLGILVDDSIVMVENNSRHLAMMARTGRTKIEAILDSVREVGVSIVFSTITRVMSFVAMFAVTGMMGDYMKPIPVFASIALIASLLVAFSLNPFLAITLHNDKKSGNHEHKEGNFLAWYGRLLGKYISQNDKTIKKRRMLKLGFWLALFAILAAPIMLDVFKARMLPKADKNQVYLWIDAERNSTAEQVQKIGEDASNFLLCKTGETLKELCLAENINISSGDRFLGDFANLFRGGTNRTQENQISMRINLVESKNREMKSEAYVIAIRPLLRNYLLEKYPDLKLRLLEDPPGPPTVATFHIKAKGQEDLSSGELTRFADALKSVVMKIAPEEEIVDIIDSTSSTYQQIRVKIDSERILETGLSVNQVSETIA
jgi:multidrug efflux pump subunit AcrB